MEHWKLDRRKKGKQITKDNFPIETAHAIRQPFPIFTSQKRNIFRFQMSTQLMKGFFLG
jgi:hypothetical protein